MAGGITPTALGPGRWGEPVSPQPRQGGVLSDIGIFAKLIGKYWYLSAIEYSPNLHEQGGRASFHKFGSCWLSLPVALRTTPFPGEHSSCGSRERKRKGSSLPQGCPGLTVCSLAPVPLSCRDWGEGRPAVGRPEAAGGHGSGSGAEPTRPHLGRSH